MAMVLVLGLFLKIDLHGRLGVFIIRMGELLKPIFCVLTKPEIR